MRSTKGARGGRGSGDWCCDVELVRIGSHKWLMLARSCKPDSFLLSALQDFDSWVTVKKHGPSTVRPNSPQRRGRKSIDNVRMTEPTSIPLLPAEILRQIFLNLLDREKNFNFDNVLPFDKRIPSYGPIPTDPRERWLSRKSDRDMRDGRHRLCPVSRVCRKWNSVAVDILYCQIQATIGELLKRGTS